MIGKKCDKGKGKKSDGGNGKKSKKNIQHYAIIDDLACTLGCTSESLNVLSTVKGVVGGILSWKQNGFDTHCQGARINGISIPDLAEDTIFNIYGAKFIIVVEKKASFNNLMQHKFYEDYPCIIIYGMCMPDKWTRQLLKRLCDDFRLPLYGVFYCNPDGIRIFIAYTIGSVEKAYDSVNITCPSMTWLGILSTNLSELDIHSQELTDRDMVVVENLLGEEYVKENQQLLRELEHLKNRERKADIEDLYQIGRSFLPKLFLPHKLYMSIKDKLRN